MAGIVPDTYHRHKATQTKPDPRWRVPQVRQARNMSGIGEHRHLRSIRKIGICMGKKHIVSVTYENERISIKKLTLLKMCVTSLLSSPWADLWVIERGNRLHKTHKTAINRPVDYTGET